jgi:ABC-type dipeptide/oligopeptide/nickel transport system permease subunit
MSPSKRYKILSWIAVLTFPIWFLPFLIFLMLSLAAAAIEDSIRDYMDERKRNED